MYVAKRWILKEALETFATTEEMGKSRKFAKFVFKSYVSDTVHESNVLDAVTTSKSTGTWKSGGYGGG